MDFKEDEREREREDGNKFIEIFSWRDLWKEKWWNPSKCFIWEKTEEKT